MLVLFTLLTKRVVSASQLARSCRSGWPRWSLCSAASRRRLPTCSSRRERPRDEHPNYRLREHVITTLGPAVTYRRRTTDEYDRKVVELVRESGTINARTIRIALDLAAVPASRLLVDLVERRILVKTSEAERGPSVTYGPGPDFPDAPKRRRSTRTPTMSVDPKPAKRAPISGTLF